MSETIRDVMHRGVVTCKVTAGLDEIAQIILDNDVTALIVTDERYDACGLITKTDLIKHYDKDNSLITAEDIMSSTLLTVSSQTPVREAIEDVLGHPVQRSNITVEPESGNGVMLFTLAGHANNEDTVKS